MEKRKYTEEQVNFVKNLVLKGSQVTPSTILMCSHFNIEYNETIGRTFRDKMQKSGVTNNVVTIEETDVFKDAQSKEHDSSKKRFIVTWAQSDTKVHKGFLKNIEAIVKRFIHSFTISVKRFSVQSNNSWGSSR